MFKRTIQRKIEMEPAAGDHPIQDVLAIGANRLLILFSDAYGGYCRHGALQIIWVNVQPDAQMHFGMFLDIFRWQDKVCLPLKLIKLPENYLCEAHRS